jgi:predicted alpha-1,6-mannanase (GH76 family)
MNLWRCHFVLLATVALGACEAAGGTPAGPARQLARGSMDDLIRHFWVGDETTGHVVNTWHGHPDALPDPRGALWERAMLVLTLDSASRSLDDPAYARRVQADWRRTQSVYTPAQLEACGAGSHTNWAADDAGWSALMYLAAYRAGGDRDPLERARGLVNNAFDRWLDHELGGGMWYSDAHSTKSLYQVAIVTAALDLWEVTGDQADHDRALQCYTWVEQHLLRDDGLYWCEYDRAGPVGANRPNDIHEAASVVYLGGNMAMGVLHARLYRLTREDKYRLRAVRTADALLSGLTTDKGIYINDRDAWTDGVFAGDWAREVLCLPGIAPKHLAALRATADSIYQNARTPDGCYGGSWSGPPDGAGSRWFAKKSQPAQIMTSANSVAIILAAASLEAGGATQPAPAGVGN